MVGLMRSKNSNLSYFQGLLGLVMVSMTLHSAPVFAGGSTDGGGDALLCRVSRMEQIGRAFFGVLALPVWAVTRPLGGPLTLNDLFNMTEVYLADTYADFHGDQADQMQEFARVLDRSGLYWEYTTLMNEVIAEEDPELARRVAAKLDALRFKQVPNVPEVEDDGIPVNEIPQGCKKLQLALQNIESGEVFVREDLYDRMTTLEKALLKTHEAFIGLQTPREIAQKNTRRIRERISALATDSALQAKIKEAAWTDKNRLHVDLFEILTRDCASPALSGDLNTRKTTMSFDEGRELMLAKVLGVYSSSAGRNGAFYVTEKRVNIVFSCMDEQLKKRGYRVIDPFVTENNIHVFRGFAVDGYPLPILANTVRYFYK